MPRSRKNVPRVQSVERAALILKSFSPDQPEMGVGELSRRLNLPKSTVFRLLSTLEAVGFINQNPRTGSYRLGIEVISLANNVTVYGNLRQLAAPHLRRLSRELQETVNLTVLDQDQAVNLDQFVTPGRLVMRVGWVGRRMPAHAVSSGKAILAFLPPEEVSELLPATLTALTPNTITELARLEKDLLKVQARGYATAFEELEAGLHAVSAPIFDRRSHPVASVSVSGPAYRLTRAQIRAIAPRVLAATQAISGALGYSSAGNSGGSPG